MGARQTLERDGHLSITVPETIETTAEDLALALAAVAISTETSHGPRGFVVG